MECFGSGGEEEVNILCLPPLLSLFNIVNLWGDARCQTGAFLLESAPLITLCMQMGRLGTNAAGLEDPSTVGSNLAAVNVCRMVKIIEYPKLEGAHKAQRMAPSTGNCFLHEKFGSHSTFPIPYFRRSLNKLLNFRCICKLMVLFRKIP